MALLRRITFSSRGSFWPVWYWIALVCISCGQYSKSKMVEGQEKAAQEARQMLIQYQEDVSRNGLMAEFKYLDSSAQFSWHPPGFEGPISYDSVATIIRLTAGQYASLSGYWDTLNVVALTDSTAIYMGDFVSAMTDVTGYSDTNYLREKGTLIRRKDGWKMRSGVTVLLEK